MKIINKVFGAVALIAVCVILAGCQKFELNRKGGSRISFNVSSAATKGTVYTTSSLNTDGQSFGLIAVADGDWIDNETGVTTDADNGNYFDAVVKYDGSDWDTYASATDTDPTDYMWLNGVGIHFWSYYPISLGTATGSAVRTISTPEPDSDVLSFTYKQPAAVAGSDATNQKDILFAGNKETREFNDAGEITTTGKDEKVDIKFYHALSEIRFCVSTDDGTLDSGLTITKVAIVNAAGSGNCTFTLPSTFVWSGLGDRTTYSQNCPALTDWTSSTFNTDKTLYTYDNPFFLIPESDLSSISLEVTFKRGTDHYITKNVALSGSWKAGCYYTYKIGATITTDLKMSLSLFEWDYFSKSYDYASALEVSSDGKLSMTNVPTGSTKTAVADISPVKVSFKMDSPIGATWLASVTNTDAFEIYTLDGTGSENPAYGVLQTDSDGYPQECAFYVRAKTGIARDTVITTKVHVTIRTVDGTYVNIDGDLSSADWTIVLNPLS